MAAAYSQLTWSEGQWTCGTECELSQWLCLDDGGVLVCVDACNSQEEEIKEARKQR